jgi:hypothetical protein
MLAPVNDNLMVEVDVNKYGIAGADEEQDGIETGIVASVPKSLYYLGMHSFAFEQSWYDKNLPQLLEEYKTLIGKRVYWSQYQERGSILKDKANGKTYALLKFTDIIAMDDADSAPASSVKTREGGSVRLN